MFLVDEVRYAEYDLYVGSDIHPSGSATINVELTAGQIVRVENHGSTILYGTSDEGNMYSWFTGHLLYPLWKCVNDVIIWAYIISNN